MFCALMYSVCSSVFIVYLICKKYIFTVRVLYKFETHSLPDMFEIGDLKHLKPLVILYSEKSCFLDQL